MKIRNPRRRNWTEEEHKRFEEAMVLYAGDTTNDRQNWFKIQEHVGTRSTAQIRSHAQKYFARMATPRARRTWQRCCGRDTCFSTCPGFGRRRGEKSGGRAANKVQESEEEREAKRLRRVQANRESARQHDRRKQEIFDDLSGRAKVLEETNETLRDQVNALYDEMKSLASKNTDLRNDIKVIAEEKGIPVPELPRQPETAPQIRTFRKRRRKNCTPSRAALQEPTQSQELPAQANTPIETQLQESNEILKRSTLALRETSLKEQQHLLFLRREISTEQEKLVDVRRQRIEEEMRRDNALKIFEYVKTTIGIAHAGFHQIPQI